MFILAAVMEEPSNADDFIRLATQEKYDAILAIEKADQKCGDEVFVCF